MGKPIQYGIVGFGHNAWGHVMMLKSTPRLRGRMKCISGFDPNPIFQEKIKKNNLQVSESFDALLNLEHLDAVIISSPPHFHADQVVAALESGKHVYAEVPMALSKKDIDRIITAEEQSGKKFELGENYIFYSEVLYASHLMESGKIGPAVYAESEYLHDVTYRWRENNQGDHTTPRLDAWYSKFDPLMYAHSIGPAQVALGGLRHPEEFTEVISYANDNGGYEGKPVCAPAKAFHVALFKTETDAIAKCANAYIFAREPTRLTLQVTGRTGTFESYKLGGTARLFEAEGHIVTKSKHRKGTKKKIHQIQMAKVATRSFPGILGSSARIMDDWISSIEKDTCPALNARVSANMCMAGIAASESARNGGKPVSIPTYNSKQ